MSDEESDWEESYSDSDSQDSQDEEYMSFGVESSKSSDEEYDSGRSHRKRRSQHSHTYTDKQYAVLHDCFKAKAYPNRSEILFIARYIKLDSLRVRNWIQNARARGLRERPKDVVVPPAESILSGCVFLPRRVSNVPLCDSSAQCTLMPGNLIELYQQGIFNGLLPESDSFWKQY
ncbi:Homeobox domain [Carpediemonas membranifera]|uniref:Homeobox domain n=1 Tax=Carpediemonas membranifera TaxID=201153 RepID=A0A8J6E1V9_9EUKA|nr:Homeobox domain [Carpediemonas membranifera]|eukprot:KAG9391132.1 Homeobox domain [Carpediemonas membranifera]